MWNEWFSILCFNIMSQNTLAYVLTVLWKGVFMTIDSIFLQMDEWITHRNSHGGGMNRFQSAVDAAKWRSSLEAAPRHLPRQHWKCGWKWRQWLKADFLQTFCSILCITSCLITVGWNRLKICKQFTDTVLRNWDVFIHTGYVLLDNFACQWENLTGWTSLVPLADTHLNYKVALEVFEDRYLQ